MGVYVWCVCMCVYGVCVRACAYVWCVCMCVCMCGMCVVYVCVLNSVHQISKCLRCTLRNVTRRAITVSLTYVIRYVTDDIE